MTMETSWNVFLTDEWDYMVPYDFEISELKKIGCQLILGNCLTDTEVIKQASDADILLNNRTDLGCEVFKSLKKLKMVIRYSIGVDNIDTGAATEHGVIIANTPNYCTEEVSDHALTLLMACARRIFQLDRGVRGSQWKEWCPVLPYPLHRLSTYTVGVLGFGKIGRSMARKCQALGMRVIAYDPYVPPEAGKNHGIDLVDLATVMEEADFVSLHIPLLPETHHMIDESLIRKMKPTCFIINAGRGAVIEEKVLVRAIKEGWIAGAGLDVLDEEPPNLDNYLLQAENVILTPHYGFVSQESKEDMRREVIESIVSLQQGRWPKATLNPQVLPKINLSS